MKKYKETIVLNKESLKNYKRLCIGLENLDNFDIDIADVLDISCEAYKYSGDNQYGNSYHTDSGYIKLSSRAKDLFSDDYYAYVKDDDRAEKYEEDDCKHDDFRLCNRMTECNDMCVFSLLDMSDRWKTIYVPYGALEEVVNRCEIDYANCPSFEIVENGDMEIRFGKLSKNPIIPRNNYSDLVENWHETLGDFNPKKLKLKVNNYVIDYTKDDECFAILDGAILNKKREGKNLLLVFNGCDMVKVNGNQKNKKTRVLMSKLCNCKTYAGFGSFLSISCSSCKVYDDDN